MGRTENINVFQDTMNLCKNNDRIRESVHNSAEGQKLILKGMRLRNQIRSDTKRKHRSQYRQSEPLKQHPFIRVRKQQYTISHRLQIRVAEWSVVQMRRKSACADVPGCLSA